MKNIKKMTALLLGITSGSLLAATLEVNFTDGAEWASAVTGKVKFVGGRNNHDLTFSGSATGDVYVNKGNVKIVDSTSFGGDIYMTGGDLEVTKDRSLPAIHANSDCKLKFTDNANDPGTVSTINTVDGSGKLTLAGAADVEIGGDMSANTGGIVTTGISQMVNLIGDAQLPNADNTFRGTLRIKETPTSGAYDSANKTINAQTIRVWLNFDENRAAAEIPASYFNGTVKANKLILHGHKWSVPVTVSAVP